MTSSRRVETGVGCLIWRWRPSVNGRVPHFKRELLLIQRKGSHGAGTWSAVGGWMERGETSIQTVLREVEEEVGVELNPDHLTFLGHTEDVFEGGRKHCVTLFFEAGPYQGPPPYIAEPDKISDIRWVAEDEPLPAPLFSPLHKLFTGDMHEATESAYEPHHPIPDASDGGQGGNDTGMDSGAGSPGSGLRGDHLRRELDSIAPDTPRGAVLTLADKAIHQERNHTYGPPVPVFTQTAEILSAQGYAHVDATGTVRKLKPHDVSLIALGIKLARAASGPTHMDTWIDLAGWAACGWECVEATEIESAL